MDRGDGRERPNRSYEARLARVPAIVERWSRGRFVVGLVASIGATVALTFLSPWLGLLGIPVAILGGIGIYDCVQTQHTILRNFPIVGHLRFVAEALRPELRQYFVESDQEENPLSREKRSIVYQRAKNMIDTQPFGTHRPIYEAGYEWVAHSLAPVTPEEGAARIWIGRGRCERPYHASRFNISAMSFGALSGAAILAMNEGARRGDFFQNTGEGGLSPYHLEHGGDVVWQIGTAYFGCRTEDGRFDRELFREGAGHDAVKMIELKLSQGAKPSHGGVLPGEKVSEEIAEARGVPVGKTVVSPPAHAEFDTPLGLLELVGELRELADGKPVGFKLCVGNPVELVAIVKAMRETGMYPDFITVDGGEGGTGAAPLEFSNSVGMPLDEGLTFVDNVLRGAGVRDELRIISAGKLTTGFHLLRQLALGADLCNAARAMMLAVGCIQALKCNTNECPTGVASQDPRYTRGLVVADKAARVASYHEHTIRSFLELLGAAGLSSPDELGPHHLFRRVTRNDIEQLDTVFPRLEEGVLLEGGGPDPYQSLWDEAQSERFHPRGGSAPWRGSSRARG